MAGSLSYVLADSNEQVRRDSRVRTVSRQRFAAAAREALGRTIHERRAAQPKNEEKAPDVSTLLGDEIGALLAGENKTMLTNPTARRNRTLLGGGP